MRIGYIDRQAPAIVHVFTGETNPERGKIGTFMEEVRGLGNIYIVKLRGNNEVVRVLVTRYI
jgi:hypothetical protein